MLLKPAPRKPRPRQPQPAILTDWTVGWSLRDLADLPTWHPRTTRDDR